MKTQTLDTPSKRISIAVGVLTALLLIGGAAYIFVFGSGSSQQANGPKIIAAAHAYTQALLQSHSPIPMNVPLQTLIDKGFLPPSDAGPFQGADATITLAAPNMTPNFVLMRVHMADGAEILLHADGSVQGLAAKEKQ